MHLPRAWLSDCVTSRIYAISVLSFIGSVCAHDKATLKAETMPFSVQPQARPRPFRLTFLELAPYVWS